MTIEVPCREYQGSSNADGYGIRQGHAGRRFGTKYVHRQVWIMAHGPIPPGMVVMHSCDNRLCFRLDHLSLGTQAENHADMVAKGRHAVPPPRVRSHCPHGHEYTDENTAVHSGSKRCRECYRIRNREARS